MSGTFGNASVSLSWTAPAANGGSAVTGYVVTPYIGATAQATQTFNSTATTETATGLTNGTAYTFTVAAINIAGTGTASTASGSVTPATTANAPTIGTATFGNASASVTWTAPTNNGGSAVTGYVVTPYKAGVAQATQTFNTTATTDTVTGLTNGSSYTFAVAAINIAGTGTASAQSNAVTPATTPGAPTGVSGTFGNASVSLSWTAPAANGGSAVTGYVVTPYIGGDRPGHPDLQHYGHHRHGHRPDQRHRLHLHRGGHQHRRHRDRLDGVGLGHPGHHGQRSHHRDGHGHGWGRLGLGHLDGADQQRWIGRDRLCDYPLQGRRGPGHPDLRLDGHHRDGYRTGQQHRLHLYGGGHQHRRHRCGLGPVQLGDHPDDARDAHHRDRHLWQCLGLGHLDGPGFQRRQRHHRLCGHPLHRCHGPGHPDLRSTATTETATGLTNGSSYTFTVAAINGVGTGTASGQSNAVIPATTPGAPTITATVPANQSVAITWNAPGNNGGSAVTGYVVTPYIGGTAQATQTFASTATTETATGLTNGTAYTFTVAAINIAGTGTASAQSASATPATTAGAPTIGTATIAGVGSATVTWTAPASNGGSAITGYVVTPYIAGVAQAIQNFSSTATTETLLGLSNNTSYTFAVAAVNGMGTGSNSAQSNSVTTPTTPGAPTIGTGTSGNASVSLSWTAPASNGGNAITGYVVTPYIAGTAQATQTFNTTATTDNVTGLTNGTAYTFKVAAINGVGTGTQWAASAAVTPATTPGAPTGVSGTSGNASVSLSWTAPTVTGGSAITGYVVTPYITGTAQTAQTFNTTATTDTVTGLTNGTAYTFKVAAINGVGTGTQSAASAAVTPATTANAPTIGTATAGVASASVSWTAPTNNGGSAGDWLRGHPLQGGRGPSHPDLQHDGHH